MRIGILETGRPPEELIAKHGDYAEMVADWASPFEAITRRYAVLEQELPSSPSEADFWIITGSKCAVYEDHSWIPPLEKFVRDTRDAGGRMFGICFGHQIIAKALGGHVEKSEKGWGLGVHEYQSVSWPNQLGDDRIGFAMQAYHQDQVIGAPQDAVLIAGSDFCPNAVLLYPGFAMSVQGHPEFSAHYMRDLITFRRGLTLAEDVADAGLAIVDKPTTRTDLAALIAQNWQKI